MKRLIYTILAWALLLEVCLGESVAVITGPTEAKPGAMFVLDAKESTGDVHQWIAPDTVGENNITCGSRFATAISEPGTYEFILIMADKDPSIAYAKHTVTITGTVPVPDKPDEPGTPPSFSKVRQASRDAAVSTGDVRTTKHMIASLDIAVPTLADKTIVEAQKSVSYVVEGVLLAREGSSRDADWLVWRRSVNAAVKMTSANTTPRYVFAVEAIVNGLRDAEPLIESTNSVLHYYTSTNCTHCRRWEREVLPTLERMGVRVVTHKNNHSEPLVPAFVYDGKKHVGFMSLSRFESLSK